MKKTLFISLLLWFSVGHSQTPCNPSTHKILMAGDSWANMPWIYASIDDNLNKYGFTDVTTYSTSNLSIIGKKAKYFLDTSILNQVETALIDNPEIKIINLSIGGNDFLGNWVNTMSPTANDSLLEAITRRIDTIIMRFWEIDSTVKVHLPMYDFPNFEEVINDVFIPNQHPYYASWSDMGFPTFLEINTQLLNFNQKAQVLANKYDHVSFVNSAGLMQYVYGQPTPLGVAPGGTYAAGSVTIGTGTPSYPGPMPGQRDWGAFKDAFHLGQSGFRHFYDYNFKMFFFEYLRSDRDSVVSSEGGNKDGYINSTTFGSDKVAVGLDGSANLTSGILSFNTSFIPSTDSVYFGQIFIKRDSLHNSKPFNGKALLEIKNGYFGSSDVIDNQDFTSTATASDTVCVYGDINSNGHFLRIDIPANLMQHFNKNGRTQFRISSVGTAVGEMFFANGNDTVYPPQLDLFYTPHLYTSIAKNDANVKGIDVYPNPNSGDILNVSFRNEFNGTINVLDMTGKKVNVELTNNQLDISTLPKGYYTIVFTENNFTTTKRFVRM